MRGSDNGRGREARQGLQPGDVRSSLRRAAAGEGVKRDEVCAKFSSARGGGRGREGAKRGKVRSPAMCEVLFGALRRAAAGEGAEPMCSSARVGVGEGAEACSSINSGRPGAPLGSSVALGSGCG